VCVSVCVRKAVDEYSHLKPNGERRVNSQACADALFDELRRLKASNATRRYLDQVIRALVRFPSEMVEAGFQALAADRSFSYRMRAKFARALGAVGKNDVPREVEEGG
jgi:hypothetical protein